MDEVLRFWFGSTDVAAPVAPELRRRWFAGGPDFDREVVARFGLHFDAPEGVEAWATSLPGALAAVVVFDQLARNAFRGTPRAFAYDPRALRIATRVVDEGLDARAGLDQRGFLYLPFEHAEDLTAQDRAVTLYRRLADEHPGETTSVYLDFAEQHRALVARFGRFPGRNRALGRASTPEEAAWLAGGGPTYGQ